MAEILPFDPAVTEAARNQDAHRCPLSMCWSAAAFDLFGVDVLELNGDDHSPNRRATSASFKRLVAVLQVHVFADDADAHASL